jgi:hypothetical protein
MQCNSFSTAFTEKRKKRGIERFLAFSGARYRTAAAAAHDAQQLSCTSLTSCIRRSKRL